MRRNCIGLFGFMGRFSIYIYLTIEKKIRSFQKKHQKFSHFNEFSSNPKTTDNNFIHYRRYKQLITEKCSITSADADNPHGTSTNL